MTHLLLLSLGPVQDFIATARRTRDLWFGSYVLSELSRAAAAAVAGAGGDLIFPALPGDSPALEPWNGRSQPAPPAVANKVLATVTGDPRDAATKARTAVRARWHALAHTARENAAGLLDGGIDEVWTEQIDTLLEFAATWAPFDGDYPAARQACEVALAGRKNLREFTPWTKDRPGAPKSSLDGARVSVLRDPAKQARDAKTRQKYRVPDSEHLDAVGVVKRCGASPDQFVPLTAIAARPWLTLARHRAPDELEAFRRCWNRLSHPIRRGPDGFDADTSPLLEDRAGIAYDELQEARRSAPIEGDPDRKALIHDVEQLLRKVGSGPSPYVACLVADGDRMGALLDAHTTLEGHQQVSTRLTAFADIAATIIHDHQGELVYAGGDDVLGFVPVSTAAACANALQAAFLRLDLPMPEPQAGVEPPRTPTLAVGIAICHVLAGMAEILEAGRHAEKLAKAKHQPKDQQGDALAITLDKRSGGTYDWRAPWGADPVETLAADVQRLRSGTMSRKKPSHIEEIANRLRGLDEPLRHEVRRALARTNLGDGGDPLTAPEVGLNLAHEDVFAEVSAWAIRQRIATMILQSTPPSTSDPEASA